MEQVRFMITAALMASCITVSGQQIDLTHHGLRSDDMPQKQVVTIKGFCTGGENGVWNMEGMEPSGKPFAMQLIATGDTLMVIERGSRTYYDQQATGTDIMGTENPQTVMDYDLREQWVRFPMTVGDSTCGCFNGTGKYCDRLFLRRYGSYQTKADMAGCLVLPGGDTLRSVIRLRTERLVGLMAMPIDTLQRAVPLFTADSVRTHLAADTLLTREEVYRWYATGYRYPVLEAMVVNRRGEVLEQCLLYCAPEVQEQLALDEENRQAREAMRLMAATNGGDTSCGNGVQGLTCQASVSSDGMRVTFTYETTETVTLDYGLYGIDGQSVYQHSRETITTGSYADVIDVSTARPGIYALVVHVNDETLELKLTINR